MGQQKNKTLCTLKKKIMAVNCVEVSSQSYVWVTFLQWFCTIRGSSQTTIFQYTAKKSDVGLTINTFTAEIDLCVIGNILLSS